MTKTKVKPKAGKDTICAYCRKYRSCHMHGRRYLCDLCGIAETGITPTP